MSVMQRNPSGTALNAAPTPNVPACEALASDLEAVLAELDAQVQRLHDIAGQRREAMRHADASKLAALITTENVIVQQVADLEKRRLTAVSRLAERLSLPEKGQARATTVAQRLGGAAGERIDKRSRVLRERLDALAALNASLQSAAQHLSSHMEGLLRQAALVLNHAKTYARTGAVTPGPAVVSALDIRS
jgi:ribosomal protein L18